VAKLEGVTLPRTVAAQYAATARVDRSAIQPGDLIFFNPHHVGIYIGDGQVVHAATPALGVRVDSLSALIVYNGYLGAGRL
jgi:cell wall-associated NlpC family hydrolase